MKLKKEELHVRAIFIGMVLLLFIVIAPLFVIGHYNFASVDDIGYANTAESVWEETHSVLKVFVRQLSYAWDYWHIWQGTFAAEWFVTSVMGIFSRDAYFMGNYLALGGFVLTEMLLFMVILKKVMGADTYRAGILSACVICAQVLLTPVPAEAFYWFCGAVLYTVVYNEAAVLLTLLVLLYDNPKKIPLKILLCAGIILLTVMVSGGTYVTLIGMLLVYLFTTLWYWYRKNPNRWFVSAGLALYMAGFLVNVLAPGNQKRLATADAADMSAIKAILLSVKAAAFYAAANTILPCVILALLFLPLFANIVKKKNYRYPFPLLVTLLSFGVFAAQFTPTIYTLGITGAGRIQNLYRWTFYIWLYGNELYWTGWFLRRANSLHFESRESGAPGKCYLLPGWLAGGVLLCLSLYIWGGDTLTTVSAVLSLRRGEAQTYYAEYQERLAVLEDNTVKDVYFEPYTYYPYLLFFGDITDDPDDWVNRAVAAYYGKDSVTLIKE